MAYKKKCSNVIKFGLHNVPRSLIQVGVLIKSGEYVTIGMFSVKAVVIGVYFFGVMTLLGRASTDDGDNRERVFTFINDFFPFVPSIQVNSPFIIYRRIVTLKNSLVFCLLVLANFWKSGSQSLRWRWKRYRYSQVRHQSH